MPDDTKFDAFLQREVKDYNAPVPPPADAIWAAIEQDVADAIRPRAARPISARRTWLVIGGAIAATLVIGVGVGRWTARAPIAAVAKVQRSQPASDDSARMVTHVQASTMEHLAETEIFLTTVRADLKSGRSDTDRAARSRELLARTRLLLGAANTPQPEVRRLLQDLELLLAEISALPRQPSMDQRMLDETMRHGNILPRIRTTLPASAGT